MKIPKIKIITTFLFTLFFAAAVAQEAKVVYYFEIDENIAKPAARKTEKAVSEATERGADLLFLRLNTFGGELESADKIRTLLLNAPMPTAVFIDNNAASAGALISLACDSIYMSPGASIGAASVVDQNGNILPDKYQSYMRSLMRTTAEKNGRDPLIAQAMVDPDTYIAGISDTGKVLTFTTQEALAHGYCEAEVSSRDEALRHANITNYQLEEQELTVIDKIIGFLVNPIVSGILIMLIIGGIYFEFQTPGIGMALVVAAVAALLYFAPHYLEGLAAHWEILLFIVGIALILLEIFVVPGFGITGISGIILVVSSLVLSMIFNIGFDFHFVPQFGVLHTFLIVVIAGIVGFFASLWLGKKLLTTETRYGNIAFKTVLATDAGYISQDMSIAEQIGKIGIAKTFMRPAGKIEIEGKLYDSVSASGVIERGETVRVIKFENAQLIVEKTDNSATI